jgi:VWFA-related protein
MPRRLRPPALPHLDRSLLGHPQGRHRLALALLLFCAPVAAQEAQFTASTRLALIEASAHAADGKPLASLTPEDFLITENDVSLTPSQIARDELPLDLVLVIDTSGSMFSNISRIAGGAHAALSALRPGDRIALLSFNHRSRWRHPLSADFSSVEAALNALVRKKNFGGGTTLNTPIHRAAQQLRSAASPARRRAILILTDGVGEKGTRSNTVLKQLWEADTTLNAILMRPSRTLRGIQIANRILKPYSVVLDASVEDLAQKTSGEVMRFDDSPRILAEMLTRIRSRYTLYYPPPDSPAKERKVSATLSPSGKARFPGATAHGRRQYLVP